MSKKRYSEAARVLLDYAQDSRQAVIALVQGNSFSEARRIVSQITVFWINYFSFGQLSRQDYVGEAA